MREAEYDLRLTESEMLLLKDVLTEHRLVLSIPRLSAHSSLEECYKRQHQIKLLEYKIEDLLDEEF